MGALLSCQSPVFPIIALIASIIAIGIFSANVRYFKRVMDCQYEKPTSTCPGSPITGGEAGSMYWLSILALIVSVLFAVAFLYQVFISRRARQAIASKLTTPNAFELGFTPEYLGIAPVQQGPYGVAPGIISGQPVGAAGIPPAAPRFGQRPNI